MALVTNTDSFDGDLAMFDFSQTPGLDKSYRPRGQLNFAATGSMPAKLAADTNILHQDFLLPDRFVYQLAYLSVRAVTVDTADISDLNVYGVVSLLAMSSPGLSTAGGLLYNSNAFGNAGSEWASANDGTGRITDFVPVNVYGNMLVPDNTTTVSRFRITFSDISTDATGDPIAFYTVAEFLMFDEIQRYNPVVPAPLPVLTRGPLGA